MTEPANVITESGAGAEESGTDDTAVITENGSGDEPGGDADLTPDH